MGRVLHSIDVFQNGAYTTTCKSTNEVTCVTGLTVMQVRNLIKSGNKSNHGYRLRLGKEQLKSEL